MQSVGLGRPPAVQFMYDTCLQQFNPFPLSLQLTSLQHPYLIDVIASASIASLRTPVVSQELVFSEPSRSSAGPTSMTLSTLSMDRRSLFFFLHTGDFMRQGGKPRRSVRSLFWKVPEIASDGNSTEAEPSAYLDVVMFRVRLHLIWI